MILYKKMYSKTYIAIAIMMIAIIGINIGLPQYAMSFADKSSDLISRMSLRLNIIYFIDFAITALFLVGLLVFAYISSIGLTRELMYKSYGKKEFFITNLIQNVVLIFVGSFTFFFYLLSEAIFTAIQASAFNYVTKFESLSDISSYVKQAVIIFFISLAILYFIMALKDHYFNTVNKYNSKAKRVISVVITFVRYIAIAIVGFMLINTIVEAPYVASFSSQRLIIYASANNPITMYVAVLSIVSIIDYYVFYHKEVCI